MKIHTKKVFGVVCFLLASLAYKNVVHCAPLKKNSPSYNSSGSGNSGASGNSSNPNYDLSEFSENSDKSELSKNAGSSGSINWENFSHPLWSFGKFALGASLSEPLLSNNKGTQPSKGSLGVRAGISDGMVLDAGVLLGIDKESEKQNVAAKLEILQTVWSFLKTKPTPQGFWAFPYFGLGFSFGQNSGNGNKPRTDFQAAVHASFGAEIMLLSQLSLGIQTGLQAQVVPSKWLKVISSTTGIQTHIYF